MAPDNRCEIARQSRSLDEAFRRGDLDALRQGLSEFGAFPNLFMPFELGLGDHPLGYAIFHSPLAFIDELLTVGANPNYPDQCGFPSIVAAITSGRADMLSIVRLLLQAEADPNQRGINDWTPLHLAVGLDDPELVDVLLGHGADPTLRIRIDDFESPVEQATRTEKSATFRVFAGTGYV